MNPWLAGLGAGLQSAGQSAMQLLAQEQQRREREAERKAAKEQRELMARIQAEQILRERRKEGYEDVGDLEQQIKALEANRARSTVGTADPFTLRTPSLEQAGAKLFEHNRQRDLGLMPAAKSDQAMRSLLGQSLQRGFNRTAQEEYGNPAAAKDFAQEINAKVAKDFADLQAQRGPVAEGMLKELEAAEKAGDQARVDAIRDRYEAMMKQGTESYYNRIGPDGDLRRNADLINSGRLDPDWNTGGVADSTTQAWRRSLGSNRPVNPEQYQIFTENAAQRLASGANTDEQYRQRLQEIEQQYGANPLGPGGAPLLPGLVTGQTGMPSSLSEARAAQLEALRQRLASAEEVTLPDGTTRRMILDPERTPLAQERARKYAEAEAERTRGVQALVRAGYSDGEARAIMASPEKLQSAILERIRPTPKGQPQEIVQPDGSVTYVQVPVLQPGQKWDSGLKQRTPPAPGSTPYNWALDTDDATGQRVLVDPRTGQSRPVTTPGGDPMRNLPDQVKKRANAIATMEAALNRYEALVKQNGLEIMPGEGKSQLEAARTNLQIPWKTYAELGALSGPDMGLVIDAVGDATSINAVGAGDKGILAKIGEARIALNREKQLFTELYKFPIPGQGGAPQGAQLSPQEQAIYDAAKMEGKSDAEIMAFLQKMRGGGR